MKAIILAAGKGKRMGKLTAEIPKCMVEFSGKPILEYILNTLNKNKAFDQVVVIRGYKANAIQYSGVRYYDAVETHNMVETLFVAQEELNDDLLILYSDIIISDKILNDLIQSKHDISVCIDSNWQELYQLRFDAFADDLESCLIDNNGNITNIGEKKPNIDEVSGQYFGVIKLSKKGCETFRTFYYREQQKDISNRTWLRGRSFDSMYMTDFLQGLINDGSVVKAVMCNRGWLEFDSEKDLDCYQTLKASRKLNDFIDL